MRALFVSWAIAAFLISSAFCAEKSTFPEITPVQLKNWRAPASNVKAVLQSASIPLWKHFPDRELDPILVRPKGGPIVLFKRGENGEYDVRLNTGGLLWAQYSYQFSHEFCHILCNYRQGKNPNAWFEEAICELASIYSLRRMGETWKTDAPYANWRGYSDSLTGYAQDLVDKTKVPKDLKMWYRLNRALLRNNATIREKNRVVSLAMLPIFEGDPSFWGAIEFINDAEKREELDLAGYLNEWKKNAPAIYGEGISEIADLFGLKL